MILRALNWQGIAGIGVAIVLVVMVTVQKLESVRWRKQSERTEQLDRQEQAAFAVTVANARAAADAAHAADRANATRVAAQQDAIMKGFPMTSKPVWLTPVLALTACAATPKAQPIPVLAQTRQCPAYPLPPGTMLKAPAKIDFLQQTH